MTCAVLVGEVVMVGVFLAVLVVIIFVGELVGLIGGFLVALGLCVWVSVGRRVLVEVGGAVGTV
jgi:hypothetical protein